MPSRDFSLSAVVIRSKNASISGCSLTGLFSNLILSATSCASFGSICIRPKYSMP
jgi:hypothetical protein